jgi:predicted esterase
MPRLLVAFFLCFVLGVLPTVHAVDLPTPDVFVLGGMTYAYYHAYSSSFHASWLLVFLPGGLGFIGILYGCGGNLFWLLDPSSGKMMQTCWPIASKYWWVAAEFGAVGFDMVTPLTYVYSYSNRDWLRSLLAYMKSSYGYQHMLLAGFSAGGAAVASAIAWSGITMNGLVDAAAIYEAPTLQTGALGSAVNAWNVTVPVFLAYGNHDSRVDSTSGSRYASMLHVEYKLMILNDGHDDTIIIETLPELQQFLGLAS